MAMLSRSALQWLLLALLLPATLAFDVKGRIDLSTVPGNHSIPIGSKVTFGHSSKSALVRHDGSFELHNVGDGEHVLEAIVPGYIIIPYLITVKNPDGIHIQPYHPSRAPLSTSTLSLPHPMRLTPKALEEFYTDARGLNIFGMLKSPMVLMMLFSGIMMFAVPKLMANLEVDPEMAAEIAESRKRVQGLQNGDFMSSLSSMLAGTSDSTASAPAKPVASSGSGAGAGGARRRKGK